MTWNWVWGQLSYILAVLFADWMVAFRMPKKNKFYLKSVISWLLTILLIAGVHFFFIRGKEFTELLVFFNTSLGFLMFLLGGIGVWICFDCNIWAALFCGTVGYCMQHISQRIFVIIRMFSGVQNEVAREVILTAVTVASYLLVYFFLIRRRRYHNIIVDNRRQLVVASIVVLVTIFLNTFALRRAGGDQILRLFIILFSMLIGLIGILYEFNMADSKNAEMEKDALTRMRTDEQEQYHFEKAMIDELNIKCHDLKHRMLALTGKEAEQVIKDTKQTLEKYEGIFKTGNVALDVVLTRKGLACREKGIKMSCLAYGDKLSFMTELDIYSLFGNIIDNAIEAVGKVPDDKKVISLTISAKDSFLSVRATNYFAGKLEFDKTGLPKTTKSDRVYHGFGMQSIKTIVDRYKGDLVIKTEEDRFIMDILFQI